MQVHQLAQQVGQRAVVQERARLELAPARNHPAYGHHGTPSLPPGPLVLHGNRLEWLADAVAEWLAAHPLAPLAPEVMLVPSNGMAEWLKMSLAQRWGVCAAAQVELPARFIWRLYRQVLGGHTVPLESALDKAPLTWRLMQGLAQWAEDPVFAPLKAYLGQGRQATTRRWQLAQTLADLFDQYQMYRADWLDDWAENQDRLRTAQGGVLPLPGDQAWQPELWRRVLATVTEDADRQGLRPVVHRRAIEALRSGQATAHGLPSRVLLFGTTHLPASTLDLLASLATRIPVMLALPNPCGVYWGDILDGRELLRASAKRHQGRGLDLSQVPLEHMHAHAHPLLAAWGRQARDLVRQLDAFDESQRLQAALDLPRIDLFDDHPAEGLPWLGQVQAHIRDLRPLHEHPSLTLDAQDQSIVFRRCHSLVRELEVLQDHLLSLMAAPSNTPLQPRDMVVMVPDIATAAPAIRAVFGAVPRHDPRFIPFDIADLSSRDLSPLLAALDWLLRLPQQRCTVSELRDLLDVPALRHRFGLPEESLPRLNAWMEGSAWRWGLSAAHRQDLDLGAAGDTTSGLWALRRMLLGFMSGPRGGAEFARIAPYTEVGGLEAEWAGGLALLLERLLHWWARLASPASPREWAERFRALLADLLLARSEDERQTLAALDKALSTWLGHAEQAQLDAELPLDVAREAWLNAVDEPSVNKRFKAGGLTFCTLMPMRAIPFELVALLGMNEGDYPRRAPRNDFDLLALPGMARPGDRSRRDDDRQLMLDALLAARRVLYVSWAGFSPRNNSEQPPSVLVAQLRDYLARGWGEAAVQARTVDHPLQPFSRRYFERGSALHTWAAEWRGAHERPEPRLPETAAAAPAEADAPQAVRLKDLARWLKNPAADYLRRALQVVLRNPEEAAGDDEVFSLDGLAHWQLGDAALQSLQAPLLALCQEGGTRAAQAQVPVLMDALVQRWTRSGLLPLGAPGAYGLARLKATWQHSLQAWLQALQAWPVALGPLALHRPHAQAPLDDWLTGLRSQPQAAGALHWLDISASKMALPRSRKDEPDRVRPEKLLSAWLGLTALAAQGQLAGLTLVGADATVRLEAPDADSAGEVLDHLLSIWAQGQTRPLPLTLKAGLAHALGQDVAKTFEGDARQAGDLDHPAVARLYPNADSLLVSGEFEDLAERVYGPVVAWAAKAQIDWHGPAGDDGDDREALAP
ncbi:MAG: exodeoxyribonuclease V subunit gamma [Ideonella sp. MAG2]|nr:MAG: exodeoxyribonuclease V subunit gamma [Ideonella sp. MAG2]